MLPPCTFWGELVTQTLHRSLGVVLVATERQIHQKLRFHCRISTLLQRLVIIKILQGESSLGFSIYYIE